MRDYSVTAAVDPHIDWVCCTWISYICSDKYVVCYRQHQRVTEIILDGYRVRQQHGTVHVSSTPALACFNSVANKEQQQQRRHELRFSGVRCIHDVHFLLPPVSHRCTFYTAHTIIISQCCLLHKRVNPVGSTATTNFPCCACCAIPFSACCRLSTLPAALRANPNMLAKSSQCLSCRWPHALMDPAQAQGLTIRLYPMWSSRQSQNLAATQDPGTQ
jgi:hypothetical protein